MLTVIMLSCRRINYLRQALSSIQDHFRHIERDIDAKWICFDNGSSAEDRVQLEKLGFDLLLLSRENMGIGPAMNRLMGAVRTPYFLNLQDDWIVDNPLAIPFVRESIRILESDRKIAQVKLDAVHFMHFDDRQIYDGPFRIEDGVVEYFIQNPRMLWGGFTFPPGIARIEAIHELGPFTEETPFRRGWAESEYSARFSRNYVVAKSPDMLIFEHIGDQTCGGWAGEKDLKGVASPSRSKEASSILKDWGEGAVDVKEFGTNPADWEIYKTSRRRGVAASPERKRIAFIGPWVGEFGWEICRWQAGVRKMVKDQFSDAHVIVAGDIGHYPLYELADEYWSLPPIFYKQNLARETYRLLPKHKGNRFLAALRGVLASHLGALGTPIEVLSPKQYSPEEQEFVLPQPTAQALDFREMILRKHHIRKWLCVFPRHRAFNPRKNWPVENWRRMCDFILKRYGCGVVELGREEDTARIEVEDPRVISMLDVPPDRRMDLAIAFLRGATASIGSECGGPFLALLCGCPTLVMGGDAYEKRYVVDENPMRTLCRFIARPNYSHEYGEVIEETTRFLDASFGCGNKKTSPNAKEPPVSQPNIVRSDRLQESRSPSKETILKLAPQGSPCGGKILFLGVFDEQSTNTSQAQAFQRVGCEVITYPYRLRAREAGLKQRDHEVVRVCKQEHPDLVVFSKCNHMDASVIRQCAEISTTVLWYMDPPHNFDAELVEKINACALTFCARRGPFLEARKYSDNVFFLQEGFDPSTNHPMETPFRHEVTMIGQLRGERIVYQKALGFHVYDNAYGEEHSKAVSESKINLNFTDDGDGTSDRTYKVLASGGFLLTQPWLGMEIDFSVGNEFDIFQSIEDLKDKVAYYLANEPERLRISRNGLHAVQRFSRDAWARHIVEISRSHCKKDWQGSVKVRKKRHQKRKEFRSGFSIIIPSWNNLPYLKKAVQSIRECSEFDHEILVHVNEGADGTLDWVKSSGLKHTSSERNVGVCVGVNRVAGLATRDLVMYFNDDMIALPGWDTYLVEYAENHDIDKHVWLSSTLIEPTGRNADFIAPANYGSSLEQFNEEMLLIDLPSLRYRKKDTCGTSWAPNLLYRETFDKIGRFSEEFSPGFGSDPDLAKKVWDLGAREFVGVAKSLVYHFQCKCTSKLVASGQKNDSYGTFLKKYGMSIQDFIHGVLKKESCFSQKRSHGSKQ